MSSLLVAREPGTEKEQKSHPCEGREDVWGNTGILPLIINLRTRWKWVIRFTLQPLYDRKVSLVPNEQVSRRNPDPVWTLWGSEKSLVAAENRGSIPRQGHCAKL